jgi:hypothetical protein
MAPEDRLLLDLGAPFNIADGEVLVESDAHQGLHSWLENFDSLTVCAPTVPTASIARSMRWMSAQNLIGCRSQTRSSEAGGGCSKPW